jgi:hypothetical protein
VNAGQLNRSNKKALAASTASLSLDSTTSLTAFYAGLKKSGKKPGKAHPCARCGSPTHWVVDCTKPTDANENSNNNKKKKGKGEQPNETAAPAQAIKATESSETAAFVSDMVTSFDSNSIEHLFLTSDYSHLSLVARSNRWIIDSGASEHMTGDESLLFDVKALDSTIRIATAGSGTLEAPSIGSTSLLNKRKEKVTLGKFMFVRGLGFNLISVPGLTRLGADVRFKGSLCRVLRNNVEVLRARLQDKAYIVEATQQGDNSFALNKMVLALPASIELSHRALTSKGVKPSGARASWEIWHRRLGHLASDSMRTLFGRLSTGGRVARSSDKSGPCEGCVMGKIVRPPFPPSESRAEALLDIVHTNLCGPMGVRSEGGAQYLMVLVDDRSRYTWAYFLKNKSDALGVFKDWMVKVERFTERKVKAVR